ncbi:hypothetical protein [Acetobacter syzygii]|uniref:hypothetical protein n=2 Tax=Acetobacter syzygii TaxID=146476 RepID=UPI000662BE86|nr:hypothetical protein [Acetobacter syzygii]
MGRARAASTVTEQAMTATTGSGSLPGAGSWVGLGAEGAAMPSAATMLQAARTALAQAQAQQADVLFTLSEGAQNLLGSALLSTEAVTTSTTEELAAATQGTRAAFATDGTSTLAADVMQAANAVLNDTSTTVEQKNMATALKHLVTAMGAQSATAEQNAAGLSPRTIGQTISQMLDQQAGAAVAGSALGGAVVTPSGLYGLASSAVQEGRRSMATALLGMGTAQAEEIVLPGGIVQLPQQATGTGGAASGATVASELAGNGLSNALLPDLFKAIASVLMDAGATAEQKAAATALLQMFETAETPEQIPQVLLNPLLAAVLVPAPSPSVRGRLVRAALAEEVEDMGQTEGAEPSAIGAGGLRAALGKNAAYLAAVQQPLLAHTLQLTQKQEAEAVEAALAGWGMAALSPAQLMEEALQSSSILAFSQNLMADSVYMGALASTGLTPVLVMSWAALLSGCLPRAYPFVPRVWRRANKRKWTRKKRPPKMDFQNLFFTDAPVQA